MSDTGIGAAELVVLGFMLVIFAVHIACLVWVYNDAERRGKSGCLVMLLVFFLPVPAGLIAWLLFRPPDRRY